MLYSAFTLISPPPEPNLGSERNGELGSEKDGGEPQAGAGPKARSGWQRGEACLRVGFGVDNRLGHNRHLTSEITLSVTEWNGMGYNVLTIWVQTDPAEDSFPRPRWRRKNKGVSQWPCESTVFGLTLRNSLGRKWGSRLRLTETSRCFNIIQHISWSSFGCRRRVETHRKVAQINKIKQPQTKALCM